MFFSFDGDGLAGNYLSQEFRDTGIPEYNDIGYNDNLFSMISGPIHTAFCMSIMITLLLWYHKSFRPLSLYSIYAIMPLERAKQKRQAFTDNQRRRIRQFYQANPHTTSQKDVIAFPKNELGIEIKQNNISQ
jgi:hypothetical protein